MIVAHKGIKINYQVSGKGPVLVFLHGFLENLSMWETITPHFESSYTCITIDLLGHGKTDCLGYIHTMEDMAKAVQTVLIEQKINHVTFIGHSMGGYVSLAFLDLFTEKTVLGLVLLNSTSLPDNEERKENRTRAIQIVKKNPNAYTSMAIANLFAEKNRVKYNTQINAIKNEASKTSLQGIISALEGMKIRKDYTPTLLEYKGSKTIFSGKLDPVIPYLNTEKESVTSKTPLITFDGGHMSYLENKDKFIQELSGFLLKKGKNR